MLPYTAPVTLEEQIESFLLAAPGDGWVKSDVLCRAFDIKERQFRKVGNQHGLCTGFAISGDKGFKHVARASKTEYLQFKHRLRKHAIAELVRVRDLDRLRTQATRTVKKPALTMEKDTNQVLLFNLPTTELPF